MKKEELTKDQLEEAKGSRPADQEAGDKATPAVKPEASQSKEPSKDHDRDADQGGEEKEVGDKPKDASTKAPKVDAPKDVVEPAIKEDDDEDEDDEEMEEGKKAKSKMYEGSEFKLADELGSLLESEDLSAEFQEAAIGIFEAAVNHASKQHLASLDEKFDEALSEAVEAKEKELEEKVEKYMDFTAQQWLEENKLAVREGVRTDITESFMQGLKELLESHYVELPEGKADLYQESIERQKDLEANLDEQIEKSIQVQEELNEAKKELAVEKFVREMTDVQADKIRSLAEGVDYDGDDAFQERLVALKENYFPAQGKGGRKIVIEDVEGDKTQPLVEAKQVSDDMLPYVQALSTFGK